MTIKRTSQMPFSQVMSMPLRRRKVRNLLAWMYFNTSPDRYFISQKCKRNLAHKVIRMRFMFQSRQKLSASHKIQALSVQH